jgi:hypothetical protein
MLKMLDLLSIFKKVCAWWVPKMLMFNQKMQHVPVSTEDHQFELEGNIPRENSDLERDVGAVLQSQSGPAWKSQGISTTQKKNSRQLSACKIMADVFLGFRRSDSYLFSSTCFNN